MTDPGSPDRERPPSLGPSTGNVAGPPTDKSVGAALVLTFFFGPLGLFYLNVLGAVLATIGTAIVAFFTVGFALFIIWPICMIWAAIAAGKKHQEYDAWKIGRITGGPGVVI